jgi:hypothetical protein
VESASPHEAKLVEANIDISFTRYAPDKLVGDKAYETALIGSFSKSGALK